MDIVNSAKVERRTAEPGLNGLFRALSNPHRLNFLEDIAEAPRSASELAHVSGLSIQEALRHLKQLADVGAIQRRPDRSYILAPTGGVLRQALAPVHGLVTDPVFTREHDLRFVPQHLCLAPVLGSPRIQGTETEVVTQLLDFMLERSPAVSRAGSQSFLGVAASRIDGSPLAGKLQRWRAVFSRNVIASEAFLGWADVLAKLAEDVDALDVRVSMLPEVPFDLTVNERGMALLVQRADGRLDLTNLIVGRSADARSWASALFRDAEERATVVFDTGRGDRLRDWRRTVQAAAASVRDGGPQRRF